MVLGGLIIVSGFIMLWQWNNVRAVAQSFQYSKEELASKIETSKIEELQALEKYGVTKVKGFSFEEEEALRKGTLTASEAALKLQEDLGQDQVMQQKKSLSKEEEIEAIITKHMANMYAIKAHYIAALGNLEKEARAEFALLPKEEHNMSGAKKVLISKIGIAADLEASCNQEVQEVLANLENELNPLTEDLSIVEQVASAYEEEKVLKKAYYLSLLEN